MKFVIFFTFNRSGDRLLKFYLINVNTRLIQRTSDLKTVFNIGFAAFPVLYKVDSITFKEFQFL